MYITFINEQLIATFSSGNPVSVHCFATVFKFSSFRPHMARRHPRDAKWIAAPAPIPELAPTCSSNLIIVTLT